MGHGGHLARGKLACAGGGGGSWEPPEGEGGGGSGNGAPVTEPMVKTQFFAIFAIYSPIPELTPAGPFGVQKGHGQGLAGSSLVRSNVMLPF